MKREAAVVFVKQPGEKKRRRTRAPPASFVVRASAPLAEAAQGPRQSVPRPVRPGAGAIAIIGCNFSAILVPWSVPRDIAAVYLLSFGPPVRSEGYCG